MSSDCCVVKYLQNEAKNQTGIFRRQKFGELSYQRKSVDCFTLWTSCCHICYNTEQTHRE